jgi:hypothetical protein
MLWQDSWVARVVRFVRVRVRESMNDHRGRATACHDLDALDGVASS